MLERGQVDWSRAIAGGSEARIVRRGDVALKVGITASGRAKVDAEQRWLTWVAGQPSAISRSFVPVVVEQCAPGVLAMPWLHGVTARQQVLAGTADPVVISRAVNAAAIELFETHRCLTGDVVTRWWSDQLTARLAAARIRHRSLVAVQEARRIRLPGGAMANPIRSEEIDRLQVLLACSPPTALGPIHGDLHLGNLLVPDGGPAVWIDPRGGFSASRCFDVAYDVAKLLHEPQYVAARSQMVSARFRIVGDDVIATPGHQRTHAQLAPLAPLCARSVEMAAHVCRCVGVDDPLVAARATLYVGLLFVSVLPFVTLRDGEWETMLVAGLLWLYAGVRALGNRMGPMQCAELWRELTYLGDLDAAKIASPDVLSAVRGS